MASNSNRKAKVLRNRAADPSSTKISKLGRRKVQKILSFAEQQGLLRGTRTYMVRGRMPEALVSSAKVRTGIRSDTELLEVALANLALADDYAEWLLSERGTVPRDLELEF